MERSPAITTGLLLLLMTVSSVQAQPGNDSSASPSPSPSPLSDVSSFTIEGVVPLLQWKPDEGARAYRLELFPFADTRGTPTVIESVGEPRWRWKEALPGTHLARVFVLPRAGGSPRLHARITLALRAAPPVPLTTGAQEHRISGAAFVPGERARELELRWSRVPGAARYLVELRFDSDPTRPPQRSMVRGESIRVDVGNGEDVTWRVRPLGAKLDPIGDFSEAVRTRNVRKVELAMPTIYQPLADEEVNAAYGRVGRMRFEWSAVPGAELYRVDIEKKDLSTGESFFQNFTTSASSTTADFELGRTERAAVRLRVRAENGESFSPWDERRFEAVRTDEPLPGRTARAQDFEDIRLSLGFGLSALSVDQQVPTDTTELPNGQAGGIALGSFQAQFEWWPRSAGGYLGVEGSVGLANFSTTFSQTGATVQSVDGLSASLLKWGGLAKGRVALSPTWSLIGGLGFRSQPRYTVAASGGAQSLASFTYISASQLLALHHQPRFGALSLQAGLEVSEALALFPSDLQLGAFAEGRWWFRDFWVGLRGSWSSSSLYYLLTNIGDPSQSVVGATTTSDTSLHLTAGFPL